MVGMITCPPTLYFCSVEHYVFSELQTIYSKRHFIDIVYGCILALTHLSLYYQICSFKHVLYIILDVSGVSKPQKLQSIDYYNNYNTCPNSIHYSSDHSRDYKLTIHLRLKSLKTTVYQEPECTAHKYPYILCKHIV